MNLKMSFFYWFNQQLFHKQHKLYYLETKQTKIEIVKY